MTLPYELYLALRYIRLRRGRLSLSVVTLISVAGVAVGTAAMVIALALMTGFHEDLRERVLGGGAHLNLVDLRIGSTADDADVLARVEEVEHVAGAGRVLRSETMLVHEGRSAVAPGEIYGVDPRRHQRVVDLGGDEHPLAGLTRPTESGRAGIILGEDLAAAMGVVPGDLVRALVPKLRLTPFAPIPRSRVFEVVDTFVTGSYLKDSSHAYIGLDAFDKLLGGSTPHTWIEVRLERPRAMAETKTALSELMGEDWLIHDALEQNAEFLRALNTEKLALFLAIGLIAIVASLNIASTLILMVTDKVKEIGTLSALGARSRGIATVFVFQGMVIGLIGMVLGLAGGTAVSWVLDRFRLIPLSEEVYFLPYVPFRTTPGDVIFAAALALAVSLLATIYPAWRASRLDPVEAIRHE